MILEIKLSKLRILTGVLLATMFLPVIKCEAQESVSSGDVMGVSASAEITIPVTELDLGDCPRQMTVGTSQMISVLVIPVDATETVFSYESDKPEVASVNALGRLTAKKKGMAKITVTCGNVRDSFTVNVIEDLSIIEVQDIELEDIEEELNVGSKISLNAVILPINATNTAISYRSSDTNVAKVNSSGEVKGIAPGEVTIEICAGNVIKRIALTVKIATKDIQLNSNYVILKPEETFQIDASVKPHGTGEQITYKSLNPMIATVSETGMITAKSCGDSAIAISNGELYVSLAVIVNQEGKSEGADPISYAKINKSDKSFPNEVKVEDYPIISSEMLRYFYKEEEILTVNGDGYAYLIDGKEIVNFENELNTKLYFEEQKDGFSFFVNDGKELCGKLVIDISDKITNERYLYLYNGAKQEYERVETEDIGFLNIDMGGRYLITSKKTAGIEPNVAFIMFGGSVIIIGGAVYIVVKKQYWFW